MTGTLGAMGQLEAAHACRSGSQESGSGWSERKGRPVRCPVRRAPESRFLWLSSARSFTTVFEFGFRRPKVSDGIRETGC